MSGRGKSKASLALVDAAIRIAESIQPITIRGLCYQLFIAGLLPSMAKGNTDKVSKQLVWAREQGLLPWAWVVDETREAERIVSWENPEALARAAASQYRKDRWASQPNRVEVWSEKGTIRGTLQPVLKKYGVTFRVMHGYASATTINDIATDTASNHKPLTALYCGDWDPSGLNMSEVDLPDRITQYGGTVLIIRVALDKTDVAAGTALPSFDLESKSKDPRYKWFLEQYGRRCWEVDAISPVTLRERVEGQILGLLDPDAWEHDAMIEQAEIGSMDAFFASMAGISGQASKYSGAQP